MADVDLVQTYCTDTERSVSATFTTLAQQLMHTKIH